MASSVNAVYCVIVAAAIWTFIGLAIGRLILPRALAIGSAPILGWAIHSVISLPLVTALGFSIPSVAGSAMLCCAGGVAALFFRIERDDRGHQNIPWYAFLAAAALALVPAAAIAPKISADSVQLADQIFDHSKIAIIDAIVRLGLPPVNPFFGEGGEPGRLVYYYLYYFSAAQVVLILHVSGWEADIALTWFAAYASLALMMALAVWFGRRSSAALWVVALTCGTSLRDCLAAIFGTDHVDKIIAPATGFAGWLFQAAWVPQHLTSASCVVLALVLIAQLVERQTMPRAAALALVVVGGFESSTYVGGVTFAASALIAVPFLFFRAKTDRRTHFIITLGAAALLVVCMTAPFVVAQLSTIGQRDIAAPFFIHPFEVLSGQIPEALRHALDLPAYWLVLLPIEFPAVYVAGILAFIALFHARQSTDERDILIASVALAVAGLSISWLLVADLGGNNDLGMRAVLPSAMVLTAAAAAGIVMLPPRRAIIAAALVGLLLSLPHTYEMIRYDIAGNSAGSAKLFAQSPDLWAAVRRYTEPNQRVGNNPLYLKDMTPWPANISWALLADRSACFPADELAVAYVPIPRERREAILAQFIRVFSGKAEPDDVSDLANRYGCAVVVVTPQDGAWSSDPFAASALYRLVAGNEDRWRIYKANAVPGAAR